MTFYSASQPNRTHRRSLSLIAVGVGQLILSAAAGGLWFLSGVGVGMCSDSGNYAYCDRVGRQWTALGLLAAVNACVAIAVLIAAGSPERGVRRTAGVVASTAAIALVVFGAYYLMIALEPVPH